MNIEEINLSETLNNEDFEIFVENLSKYNNIGKLKINKCLNNIKAIILLNYLIEYPNVEELDLSNNEIEGWGLINVDKLLKVTKTLKILDLSGNFISNIGPQFREGLEQNHSLKILKLKNTGIDGSFVSDIVEGMIINKTLQEVDLSDNPTMGDGGAIAIKLLYLERENITVNLNGCNFSNFGLKKIREGNPNF